MSSHHTSPSAAIRVWVLLSGILLGFAPSHAENASRSDTLVVYRFENTTADSSLNIFHLLLRKQFDEEMLFPDLSIQASGSPFRHASPSPGTRFAVHGVFESDSPLGDPTVLFIIDDLRNKTTYQNRIPLHGMLPDDLARVIALKAGSHLREKTLGKLIISSSPPGCQIFIDGVRTGLTPREFSLQPGRYTLQLHGEFLSPFKGEVDILEAKPVNLNIHMNYKGYPTLHWLTAAFLCTGLTMVTFVMEQEAYRAFESSGRCLPDESGVLFSDSARSSYTTKRTIRLGFQQLAVVGWTGTGFCYFMNRSIARRIFGRNS